jgi:hypothetical protein
MENLWSFIAIPEQASGYLALEDFSALPAPRQAEWFDREFRARGGSGVDVAALRLHILGRALHRSSRILTNPLLQQLAKLIILPVAGPEPPATGIDVITANVDCALEQNIAWAFEQLTRSADERPGSQLRLSIESIVNFRLSARWSDPAATPDREAVVRVWKLHGCLRDLKVSLALDTARAGAVLRRAGDEAAAICGHVPIDQLAENLAAAWGQTDL